MESICSARVDNSATDAKLKEHGYMIENNDNLENYGNDQPCVDSRALPGRKPTVIVARPGSY